MASTISVQVTETGFSPLTKTYNLQDAELNRLVAAYQVPANAAVNSIATRTQVLNYWVSLFMNEAVDYIKTVELQAAYAAIPPVVPINPQ